ncbi:TPA: hypothetical protein ACGIMD_004003 [Acinetobacter baumannii]
MHKQSTLCDPCGWTSLPRKQTRMAVYDWRMAGWRNRPYRHGLSKQQVGKSERREQEGQSAKY